MRAYCRTQPQCKVSHPFGEQWGFRILTQDYALYLRCIPTPGDYNFYVFCYDKDMVMNKLAKDKGLPLYMRMEGNHILPIIMTMGWCENIPQGFLASKKYIRTFHIL